MVETLRRKFIVISVSTVFIVLFVMAGFINWSNYAQIGRHADDVLNVLIENNGYFPKKNNHKDGYALPPKMSPEAPFSTRFFTAKADTSGNIISADTSKISAASTKEALEYAAKVLKSGKSGGFVEGYKFTVAQKKYGALIIFVDCNRDLEMFYSFLQNSVIICVVGILAVFILVLIFSQKAIAPVAESYEKQKQFITDASHELKTPLAIISTNTDVLEMECGESEWIKSIRHQVSRLSELVGNLVSLTRMDETGNTLLKTDFSLSDAVSESAEPFEALAQSRSKALLLDIQKNISYCGNEQTIRQLVSILLDNAIKYGAENSSITMSLKKQGKRCVLQTINAAEDLKKGNNDMLFERFYRADNSRNSKTGGYGIGLSIAKAIVLKHKGKISAESPDGKIIIFMAQF